MMASRSHLGARELATLKLPGLPTTERGIQLLAERQGWEAVRREGRGGGRLYAVADLPEDAQLELAERARREAIFRAPAKASNDVLRSVGRPKGTDFFTRNPAVGEAVMVILASQRLSATAVMALLQSEFPELPSLRTLKRFIKYVEDTRPAILAASRDPDRFKSHYRVSLGRADGGVTRAHEIWELDTTKADVVTLEGRRMVLGVIDRFSRRARFLVAPSESGQSVRQILIDTIVAWGVVPETIVVDNGSGYINQSIVSACELLGIEHRPCPPGSPEKKPFVERLFGTFTRDRAELLDGYTGHSVADAQALRARAKKETGRALVVPKMTEGELQAILDNWTAGVYEARVHSGIGTSPLQKALMSPVPARAAPARELLVQALSAFVGNLMVGKRGLQWKRGRYWCPELVPFVGQPLHVRRDENDLGQLLAFDGEGHFIGAAINHERAGLSEQAFAEAARLDQARWMKAQRKELTSAKRNFSIEKARDAILRRDAEAAGKLVSLPQPTRPHETRTLASMAPQSTAPIVEHARVAQLMTPKAPIERVPVSQKVSEADAIIAAAHRGETIDDGELRAARLYAASSEYKAEKLLSAHFAPRPTPSSTSINREKSA